MGLMQLGRVPWIARWGRQPVIATLLILFSLAWALSGAVSMQSFVAHDYSAIQKAVEVAKPLNPGTKQRKLVTNHAGVAMWLDIDLWNSEVAVQDFGHLDPLSQPVGTVFIYAFGAHRHPKILLPFYELPADPEVRAQIARSVEGRPQPPWFTLDLVQTKPQFRELGNFDIYSRQHETLITDLG